MAVAALGRAGTAQPAADPKPKPKFEPKPKPKPKPDPNPTQAMLSPLGDALHTLASVDALHLDASCCVGLWLLGAAATLETVAGWLPC